MTWRVPALFLVPCFLGAPLAHAAYIVHEFEGTFDHFVFDGPVVPVGSTFTGLFSFEENGNRVIEPFNGGERSYFTPMYVQLTVGQDTIIATAGEARVDDAVTQFTDLFVLLGGYEVGAPFSGELNGREIRTLSIHLDGFRETFSSSDYPRQLSLDGFQGGSINLLAGPAGLGTLRSSSIRGGVENRMEFTISEGRICDTPTCAIPEPDAVLLGLLAFLGTVGTYWARRRVFSPTNAVRAMTG